MMAEKLLIISIVLIFFGILLLIVSSLMLATSGKSKVEVGAGGFIGPFPFGFFTSKKMFWIWLVLLIILFAIWFLLSRK